MSEAIELDQPFENCNDKPKTCHYGVKHHFNKMVHQNTSKILWKIKHRYLRMLIILMELCWICGWKSYLTYSVKATIWLWSWESTTSKGCTIKRHAKYEWEIMDKCLGIWKQMFISHAMNSRIEYMDMTRWPSVYDIIHRKSNKT